MDTKAVNDVCVVGRFSTDFPAVDWHVKDLHGFEGCSCARLSRGWLDGRQGPSWGGTLWPDGSLSALLAHIDVIVQSKT